MDAAAAREIVADLGVLDDARRIAADAPEPGDQQLDTLRRIFAAATNPARM
jgi:hypothetical protein